MESLLYVYDKLCAYRRRLSRGPYSNHGACCLAVLQSVEVFNEIMDTFCPEYESNPSSLSELAREQILRAIGVAIVKHGAMFPTMEILLRHAVNYLNMKKSKAVRQSGIIDNEELFMETFETISLNESRAVLCTHMLCYVLDGSVGISELHLWSKLLHRVEDAYQAHRSAFDDYDAPTLRKFIIVRCPNLTKAVSRVPTDDPVNEMLELGEIAKSVPQPRHVTNYDQLIPRVVCQKFRNNEPVRKASCLGSCHTLARSPRSATLREHAQAGVRSCSAFSHALVSCGSLCPLCLAPAGDDGHAKSVF